MVRKNAINKSKQPVPRDLLQHIDRTSSPAHMDKLRNSIDFIVDENTPALAVGDGIVIFVIALKSEDLIHLLGPYKLYCNCAL